MSLVLILIGVIVIVGFLGICVVDLCRSAGQARGEPDRESVWRLYASRWDGLAFGFDAAVSGDAQRNKAARRVGAATRSRGNALG